MPLVCRRCVLGFALCTSMLATGCSGNVRVTGTLKIGGQPPKVNKDKDKVVIMFHLLQADSNDVADSFPAVYSFDDQGSFTVKGKGGKGIPPGRYHVSVQVFDSYPYKVDKYNRKFADPKAPIAKEISSSNKKIDLDLPAADMTSGSSGK